MGNGRPIYRIDLLSAVASVLGWEGEGLEIKKGNIVCGVRGAEHPTLEIFEILQ